MIHGMSRHERAFRVFHADNPHVYASLVRLVRVARSVGVQKTGIGFFWERLRWEYLVERVQLAEGQSFKLNNNHRAYYVRMLIGDHPELKNVFSLREMRIPPVTV